ncbi:hypothetical protein Vretimale_5178 [Volvox reticuliferus]|uniref:Uncharacterized protein n=1 Tax=Volvox reticuliferus TaxID=1737510 RepID=A0A8J4FIJ9_9CHLO|nr:hypothetical protein Vretifemale_3723 [Volvox reticuliferus]GIM00387.1 hypothetical protein Vretimale_5178 [Volvox reticuliferus]
MGEPFQASISQLSFEKFINTINQDQAKDLVRNINQFMKKFRSRPPDNDTDSREVQEFLTSMEHAFARHPLWAGSTREDLDNAVEGLEKYLMTKLYDRTFGLDPLDRERDAVLSRRLAALAGFVTPAHLEVSEQFQGPLAAGEGGHIVAACKELKKMSLYKSPRDKLVQILNCCKIINDFLTSRRAGAGADDFTPALIYVTIKAQPEALASNMAFIERYRHSNRLNGESEYFFVQMQGAVAFLETLSPTSLAGCEADEFISHMLAAGAISEGELSEEQIAAQRRRTAAAPAAPPPPAGHVSTAVMPEATAAAPVYGNPMLAPRQVQQQQQQHQGSHVGAVYGSGALVPPPPPPQQPSPAHYSVQGAPSYYTAGYPPGAVTYGQPMQYYTQYAAPGMPYGQQWVAAPAPAAVPPPPPPPPSKPSPPPPVAAQLQQASQFVPLPPKSVSELERDGIRLVIKAEAAGELRAKYPYLYYTKESLTLYDVSQLLMLYKELVLRYETLAQAAENNVVKYFSDLEAYQAGLRPMPPGTTSTTSTAGLPRQPPPPPPPQHQMQQEPELVSVRNPPPPPPPPPPPATVPTTAVQEQYQKSLHAVPQTSSPPTQTSPREPLDLSQYMPSYQLETEGWPYQAQIQAATATANADVNAAATATTQQAAGAAPSPSAATFIDLLSDYTPPPPPPPAPQPPPAVAAAADRLHPQVLHQQQSPPPPPPLQQQQQPQLSPGASYGGEDDGDDKKLTPLSSVRNASLSYAAGLPLVLANDGALAAVIQAAAALDAEPAARRIEGAGVVEATSGDATATSTATASVGVPYSAVGAFSGGAENAEESLAFLEATLSPPPLPPPPSPPPPPALSQTSSAAEMATTVALPVPPAAAAMGPSSLPEHQYQQQQQKEQLQPPATNFRPEPLLLDVQPCDSQLTSSGLSDELLAPLPHVDMPPTAVLTAAAAANAASSVTEAAAVTSPSAITVQAPGVTPHYDGVAVGADGGGGGGGGGAAQETEEERQARVDALLQQFLGVYGGLDESTAGEVKGQVGAEMPVMEDSAAVDAVLAMYCGGTAAAPAAGDAAPAGDATPALIERQADG